MHACLVRDPASPPAPGALAALARACSPRVQAYGDDVVVWDASGLTRVIGTPREIAAEVAALAVKHELSVRIALARTATAAWILAHARPGQTVVEGDDSRALARLSLQWLSVLPDVDFGEPPKRTRRHARARHYRMAPSPAEPSAALPPPIDPGIPGDLLARRPDVAAANARLAVGDVRNRRFDVFEVALFHHAYGARRDAELAIDRAHEVSPFAEPEG